MIRGIRAIRDQALLLISNNKEGKERKEGSLREGWPSPAGSYARFPNRLLLFEFCAFSVVKLLRLGSSVVLLFSAFLCGSSRLCVNPLPFRVDMNPERRKLSNLNGLQ